jgi:hypothetical protein
MVRFGQFAGHPTAACKGELMKTKSAEIEAPSVLDNISPTIGSSPVPSANLGDLGFDLSLTGLVEIEIAALTSTAKGLTDPDEVPQQPEQPTTLPGDVWILGKHRLICGESTNYADVERVFAGVKPHLLVSDPPFGVNYDRPGV